MTGWIARMERALALLATRLDDPPSLDELAAAANVSPFHFHRTWRAMTGETLGQSVARLRVVPWRSSGRPPDACSGEIRVPRVPLRSMIRRS